MGAELCKSMENPQFLDHCASGKPSVFHVFCPVKWLLDRSLPVCLLLNIPSMCLQWVGATLKYEESMGHSYDVNGAYYTYIYIYIYVCVCVLHKYGTTYNSYGP